MLTVAMVVHREHLFQCFLELKREGGDTPGLDHVRLSHLSNDDGLELAAELCASIHNDEYHPSPRRPVRIPKDHGKGHRTLQVPTVKDRMLAKAVDACLTPIWERRFHPTSWGFRRRRSTWQMLAHLKAGVEATGHTVLAIADVANAFDRVSRGQLQIWHRQPIQELVNEYFARIFVYPIYWPELAPKNGDAESELDDLLRLVDWALSANPQDVDQGIDQGGSYSPTAMNVCLHFVHDEWVTRHLTSTAWHRYADNLVYLFADVPAAEAGLMQVASQLLQHGMPLRDDRQVVDIADSQAAPEVLGFTLSLAEGSVEYSLGRKAWGGLENHLAACHEADNPPAQARAVLRGWLQANGPAYDDGAPDVSRIFAIARRLGFRELATAQEVKGWSKQANDRWQATVADAA